MSHYWWCGFNSSTCTSVFGDNRIYLQTKHENNMKYMAIYSNTYVAYSNINIADNYTKERVYKTNCAPQKGRCWIRHGRYRYQCCWDNNSKSIIRLQWRKSYWVRDIILLLMLALISHIYLDCFLYLSGENNPRYICMCFLSYYGTFRKEFQVVTNNDTDVTSGG